MTMRPVFLAAFAAVIAVPGAFAQLPGAKLTSIFPPSGQAGTKLEVTIGGSDLNGAERLAFSHPGIKGEPVMAGGGEIIKRQQWQRNRFKLSIAADVPPGVYEGWFVGRYGISNPRSFVVGDLPQPAEVGGNGARATAKEVVVNSVIVGRVDAGKPDCFKLQLKAGQSVVLDCQAERIGSRLDAVVDVFSPEGKRVASGYGGVGDDPVVAVKADADGAYIIEVRDFLSVGGADRVFRLVVSDRPFVESVFPPAGLAGTKSRHAIYGYNLPGGAEMVEVEIEIPQQAPSVGGGFGLRPRELASAGASYRFQNADPVRIPLATAPVVLEEVGAEVQELALPCEVAGHLAPVGDSDSFEFNAKKGETVYIEAISHRAGHATDLQFTVSRVTVNAEGVRSVKKVAESDDDGANAGGRRAAVNSRDPFLKFSVPEDGGYVVKLVDQFRLDDPRASYRLSIRRPVPDYTLVAEIENPKVEGKKLENWSPSLLRGGRMKVGVRALKRDGFDSEIQLGLENPPAGVQVVAGKIAKGQAYGTILLIGGGEMAKWNGVLKVTGRCAGSDGEELVRHALGNSLVREVNDYDQEHVVSHLSEQVILASGDRPTPVAVNVEVPDLIETCLGGTVEIPVKIAKEGAFKGAVKFLPTGIPNIKKRPELALDLNKASEGKLTIPVKPTNENKYTAGTFEFVVQGEAVLQHHPDPVAVVEATEDQKMVDEIAAKAAETLKQVQASKAEIAKAGLTADEKAKQTAAADELIKTAQERVKIVDAAKKRAADLFKQANDRNKPRDLRVIGFSKPVKIKIESAPLRFKEVPTEIEIAKGEGAGLPVEFDRLFGFADAVELSLEPPKNLKGVELKPAPVPKDQVGGKLQIAVKQDAPEGDHAFNLLAKMTFNGVNCELRQPLKLKVVGASRPPEESRPDGAETPPPPPAK